MSSHLLILIGQMKQNNKIAKSGFCKKCLCNEKALRASFISSERWSLYKNTYLCGVPFRPDCSRLRLRSYTLWPEILTTAMWNVLLTKLVFPPLSRCHLTAPPQTPQKVPTTLSALDCIKKNFNHSLIVPLSNAAGLQTDK